MLRVSILAVSLFLIGCGPVTGPPSIRLALDGPPLHIAGDKNGEFFHGDMDRGCMAGFGRIILTDEKRAVTCKGEMDAPANEKARLHVTLLCDNGETISITMRNLGPDQGLGAGRINETSERLLLFYHPSETEAKRRLVQLKAEMEQALAHKGTQ